MSTASPSPRPETISLHGGQVPDPTTNARAVPIYQTVGYAFDDTQHAEDLFGAGRPGQHLHADHEPDLGRARAAHRRARGRHRRRRDRVRPGGGDLLGAQRHPHRRQHRRPLDAVRRHLQPVRPHPPAVRDRGALRRSGRAGRPGRSTWTTRPGWCSPRRSATRGSTSWTWTPGRRPRTRWACPWSIDNTIATPILTRGRDHGADIVVHSLTKFIGGHGTSIGGIVVDNGTFDWTAHADRYPGLTKPDPSYHGVVWSDALGPAAYIGRVRTVLLRNTGAALSPFNAFLFLQGVETLPLRIERHSENALAVAKHLEAPPAGDLDLVPGPAVVRVPRGGRPDPEGRLRRDPHLRHQGRPRGGPHVHRLARSCSATWRTSATRSRWRSTRPRRRTPSSTRPSWRRPA